MFKKASFLNIDKKHHCSEKHFQSAAAHQEKQNKKQFSCLFRQISLQLKNSEANIHRAFSEPKKEEKTLCFVFLQN